MPGPWAWTVYDHSENGLAQIFLAPGFIAPGFLTIYRVMKKKHGDFLYAPGAYNTIDRVKAIYEDALKERLIANYAKRMLAVIEDFQTRAVDNRPKVVLPPIFEGL